MSLPGPLTLLAQSWQLYWAKLWPILKLILLPTSLILLLIIIAATFIVTTFNTTINWVVLSLAIIFSIPIIFISFLGQAAFIRFVQDPNQTTSVITLFRQVKPQVLSLLLTQLLSSLFMLLGFILLIIPGIILSVRYLFVPFVVVTEGKSGLAALHQSQAYVKGKFWAVLGRSLLIGGVSPLLSLLVNQINQPIVSGMSQLLVFLVITPLATIYFYQLYQGCRLGVNDPTSRRSPPPPNP